jgi:hypothetical protein
MKRSDFISRRDFVTEANMKSNWVRALATMGLFAAVSYSDPIKVVVKGVTVGELDVTESNKSKGNIASLTIDANFTTMGQQTNGQAILDGIAPLGLTYMQTVDFQTATQQQLFKDANNKNLKGTFSDPPYLGYTLANSTRKFEKDDTPYYSTLTPAGTAGALPSNRFGTNQFEDTPMLPWNNQGKKGNINGLANILDGKNGMIDFETALVGVCGAPTPGGTPDRAFTQPYHVCVLEDFTWGFDFTYTGGGAPGKYTSADYTESLASIVFGTNISTAFAGAFDKKGNNAADEWLVKFTQANNCPEPFTWGMMCSGLFALAVWRARHRTG